MLLKEFLGVINMQVPYRVTDRSTRKAIILCKNGKPTKEVMQRHIYMVFQDKDGTFFCGNPFA